MSLKDHTDPAVRALVKDKEEQTAAKRKERIVALKKRGLNDEAEKKLVASATATVNLSFTTDGKIEPSEIDRTLDYLEMSLPTEKDLAASLGRSQVQEVPLPKIGEGITPEQSQKVADEQAANAGLVPVKK